MLSGYGVSPLCRSATPRSGVRGHLRSVVAPLARSKPRPALTGRFGLSRLLFKLALTLGLLGEMFSNGQTGILVKLFPSDPIGISIWSKLELFIHFMAIGAF
jgi:hypothetical protein